MIYFFEKTLFTKTYLAYEPNSNLQLTNLNI